MKNIFTILLISVIALALCSCRDTDRGAGPGPTEEPAVSSDSEPVGGDAGTDLGADTDTNTARGDENAQAAYAAAYIEKIRECENEEGGLEYGLIYVNEDDIPELVAGMNGYYVSVYSYSSGGLCTVMDGWPYGAMGNSGYEYIPGGNVVRNYNSDLAGAIVYEAYYRMDENLELQEYYSEVLSIWMFKDSNGNYMVDEGEYDESNPEMYYYFGEQEITMEEYNGYVIQGDYEFISGSESASAIISRLEALGAE